VILDEEFSFPDEDLDHFGSSSRNELSTGVSRRGNLPQGTPGDSSTEICSVSDDDFLAITSDGCQMPAVRSRPQLP